MLASYDVVPFTISPEANPLMEVQGLLRVDENSLLLEFRSADAFFGIVKSDLSEIKVPFTDVTTLTFTSRMMGTKNEITVRVLRQSVLEGIPESKQGVVTFEVKRKDRQTADRFCLDVAQEISRRRTEAHVAEVEQEFSTSAGDDDISKMIDELEMLVKLGHTWIDEIRTGHLDNAGEFKKLRRDMMHVLKGLYDRKDDLTPDHDLRLGFINVQIEELNEAARALAGQS